MKKLIIIAIVFFAITVNAQTTWIPVKGANWNTEVTVNGHKVKQSGRVSRNLFNYFPHSNMGKIKVTVNGKTVTRMGQRTSIQIDGQTVTITRFRLEGRDFIFFAQASAANKNYILTPGQWVWSYDETHWVMEICGNGVAAMVLEEDPVVVTPNPQPNQPTQPQTIIIKNDCCCSGGGGNVQPNPQPNPQPQPQKVDCSEARYWVADLKDDYYVRGIINFKQAKARLEALKQQYPCIPRELSLKRANKFFKWLGENAVELATLAVSVDSNVRIRKMRTSGTTTTRGGWSHNQPTGGGWEHNQDSNGGSGTSTNTNGGWSHNGNRPSENGYRPGQRLRANSMSQFGTW